MKKKKASPSKRRPISRRERALLKQVIIDGVAGGRGYYDLSEFLAYRASTTRSSDGALRWLGRIAPGSIWQYEPAAAVFHGMPRFLLPVHTIKKPK
jgi:hypothetical protein